MSKILKVIEPFFMLDLNDTLELTEDGKFYVANRDEEFRSNNEDSDVMSSYKSEFCISVKWAKQLIEDGFLEEVEPEKPKKQNFVNVFDEIDSMLNKYENELANINSNMKDDPECLRVEKTTVLKNIIKVLNHLKTLRK